jgi:hypothetical protein
MTGQGSRKKEMTKRKHQFSSAALYNFEFKRLENINKKRPLEVAIVQLTIVEPLPDIPESNVERSKSRLLLNIGLSPMLPSTDANPLVGSDKSEETVEPGDSISLNS